MITYRYGTEGGYPATLHDVAQAVGLLDLVGFLDPTSEAWAATAARLP